MSCRFDLEMIEEKKDPRYKALKSATGIATIFMLLEIVGGIVAHSLALISDALHMFTDVGAFAVSLLAIRIAKKPSTQKMSFGYRRAEVLGALGSALTLVALCLVLIYEAIHRFIHPEVVRGGIVFIIATLGLLANLLMLKVLSKGGKKSLNIKAAFLHVLGDLLGSIAVIISGIVIFFTQFYLIDPIITIFFAVLILCTSWSIIKNAILILMEATPKGIDLSSVQKDLLALTSVRKVDDLHIWSLASKDIALSAHLLSDQVEVAMKEATELLHSKYQITHTTLQIDPIS